jgi:hypothetical protein
VAILPFALPMLLAAILWSIVLTAVVTARNRAAAARVEERLSATGLTLSGDPLGTYTLRGQTGGVDVVVENGASKPPPGARGDDAERTVGLVRVGTRLVDQIVCESTKVDAVMGPLPAVPRVSTGAGMFDARYAAFVTAGAPDGAIAWADPSTLGTMVTLSLVWMRVQAGQCEVAFEPLASQDVPRAIAVGVRFAGGPPAAQDAHGAAGPRASHELRAWSGAAVVWPAALMGGFLGFAVGCSQPLLDLDSPSECPPGSKLVSETDQNGSDGLACMPWTGPDPVHYGHYIGSYVLGTGFLALLGLAIATATLPARLRRRLGRLGART